jgi:acyl-CoA thioesterase FadM
VFKKSVHFGDLIIVKMRVLRVGNSSFDLGAEFINARTKEVGATGKQVIIYTDLKSTPTNIPDTLRNILLDSLQPAKSP